MKKVSYTLNRVLVIDDVPVIAFGLLETFTALNKHISIDYESSVFSALSAAAYTGNTFDLLVIGILPGHDAESIWKVLAALKNRFGHPKLMLYASHYNHMVIEKMEQLGIDAYVHRYECMEEIQRAYIRISANERYISELFYTLYNDYCLTRDWMAPGEYYVSVSSPEKNILLLLCQGKDVAAIADILHIPVHEISMHLNTFRNRLTG
jgi:DNA-binding NarL/FixJ family response regulator